MRKSVCFLVFLVCFATLVFAEDLPPPGELFPADDALQLDENLPVEPLLDEFDVTNEQLRQDILVEVELMIDQRLAEVQFAPPRTSMVLWLLAGVALLLAVTALFVAVKKKKTSSASPAFSKAVAYVKDNRHVNPTDLRKKFSMAGWKDAEIDKLMRAAR